MKVTNKNATVDAIAVGHRAIPPISVVILGLKPTPTPYSVWVVIFVSKVWARGVNNFFQDALGASCPVILMSDLRLILEQTACKKR